MRVPTCMILPDGRTHYLTIVEEWPVDPPNMILARVDDPTVDEVALFNREHALVMQEAVRGREDAAAVKAEAGGEQP